jgi:hypothetical protein
MMRRHTVLIAVAILVCALLLAGVVVAQSGAGPLYAVARGTASGGHYRLTSPSWQVSGAASGTGYHLANPSSPAGTGTPCCCTYLPCVRRN